MLKKYSKIVEIKYSISFFIILMGSQLFIHASHFSNDTINAQQYFNRGKQLFYSHPDSSIYHLKQSLVLYQKNKNRIKESEIYNLIGISYSMNDHIDSAQFYIYKAIEIDSLLKDSLGLSLDYSNLGLIYLQNEKYSEGISYLINSLKIKERIINKENASKIDMGSTLHNIAIGYHKINDFKKSYGYYQKALSCIDTTNNKHLNELNTDLALLYQDMGKLRKAENIYLNLIENKAFENNKLSQAKLYNNYGILLRKFKQYDESQAYIQQAYMINILMKNELSTAKSLNLLAELSYSKKEYQFAHAYAHKAYKIANKNNYIRIRKNSAKIIAESNEALGNYKKALEFHTIENKLKDSIFKIEENKIIRELETKYNREKDKHKIAMLNNEKHITSLRMKKKEIQNVYLLVLLIILLISTLILVFFMIKIRKQQALLKENNEKLKFLNQQNEKMIGIISHDMRGFVSGFKGVSSLIPYYIEHKKMDELNRLSQLLLQKTNDIEHLLNSLLEWAIIQLGYYRIKPQPLKINEIVDDQIKLMSDFVTCKDIEIQNLIPKDFIFNFDKNSFVFIVRNLLSNAIKFTTSGHICFEAKIKNNQREFIVSDTGIGMSKETIRQIFYTDKINNTYNKRGNSSGLGLKLVNDFIVLNQSTIIVESIENKGTTFIIKNKNE